MAPSSLCVGEEVVNAAVGIKVLLGWNSETFADISEMGPLAKTGVGEGEGEGLAKMAFASAVHTAYIYRQSKKKKTKKRCMRL